MSEEPDGYDKTNIILIQPSGNRLPLLNMGFSRVCLIKLNQKLEGLENAYKTEYIGRRIQNCQTK